MIKFSEIMLVTLHEDNVPFRKSKEDGLRPKFWRYAYLVNCDYWFHANCSSTKDDARSIEIIIGADDDLLSLIKNTDIKINHIYLMNATQTNGSRTWQKEVIKSVYQNNTEDVEKVTIELNDGRLFSLSKKESLIQINKVYSSENCEIE
ncbi:hypothetical protein [Methylophilus sp.]|uniref:hypothetical protein n=1 Tax=Methylophilus sp. TaxID=29541 RepID=UPI003F9F724C